MEFEKDYGQGFVQFLPGKYFILRYGRDMEDLTNEAVEAFQTARCLQQSGGSILLNEQDSAVILSQMKIDEFWTLLNHLTCVPKIVRTTVGGRLILIEVMHKLIADQIEELMNAVKEYVLRRIDQPVPQNQSA